MERRLPPMDECIARIASVAAASGDV